MTKSMSAGTPVAVILTESGVPFTILLKCFIMV